VPPSKELEVIVILIIILAIIPANRIIYK